MNYKKSDMRKWANALRSGKFRQTRFALQNKHGFCCLGVACEMFVENPFRYEDTHFIKGSLPIASVQPSAPKWLQKISDDLMIRAKADGENYGNSFSFSGLNDNGYTFDEIADIIELVYIEGAL